MVRSKCITDKSFAVLLNVLNLKKVKVSLSLHIESDVFMCQQLFNLTQVQKNMYFQKHFCMYLIFSFPSGFSYVQIENPGFETMILLTWISERCSTVFLYEIMSKSTAFHTACPSRLPTFLFLVMTIRYIPVWCKWSVTAILLYRP